MKVMLLIPHAAGGGGEKIFSELSYNLRAEIVSVVFEEKFTYPVKGRLICLNIPIDRNSAISRAFGFIRRILRFRRVVRQERPDVVLSFMGEANFLNALLSSRPVLTVHNHLSALSMIRSKVEAFAVSALIRALYKRATVVAVSHAVKRDLVEKFRVPEAQIVVVPNGANIAKIQEMAAEPAVCPWTPGSPVIITAGRMSIEKGQSHLIRNRTRSGSWPEPTSLFYLRSQRLSRSWSWKPWRAVIATDCAGVREIIREGAAGDCGVLVRVAAEQEMCWTTLRAAIDM